MQVLESAKAHLEGGRAAQVNAELGPILLDEASVQGRGAFTTKQPTCGRLQLLQASPFLEKHLSRHKGDPPKLNLAASGKGAGTYEISRSGCLLKLCLTAFMMWVMFPGMQDAAVSQRDVACELKCRLVALRWLLPHVPADFDDDDAHTAPASGPPPVAMKHLQTPFKAIVTQVSGLLAPYLQHRAASCECRPILWLHNHMLESFIAWQIPLWSHGAAVCSCSAPFWLDKPKQDKLSAYTRLVLVHAGHRCLIMTLICRQ